MRRLAAWCIPGSAFATGSTGTTAYALAKAMRVPGDRLLAILAGERAITADTAIRICAITGMGAEMQFGPQSACDREVALDGCSVRQPMLSSAFA